MKKRNPIVESAAVPDSMEQSAPMPDHSPNGTQSATVTTPLMSEHPAAAIFPQMSPSDFETLKADIHLHGLRQPIILAGTSVVDGRSRLRACRDLGIKPRFLEIQTGEDPWSSAISANAARRHLSSGQRAASAILYETEDAGKAEKAEYRAETNRRKSAGLKGNANASGGSDGRPKSLGASFSPSRPTWDAMLGKRFGASDESIRQSRELLAADRALFNDVFMGRTSLNAAFKMIDKKQKHDDSAAGAGAAPENSMEGDSGTSTVEVDEPISGEGQTDASPIEAPARTPAQPLTVTTSPAFGIQSGPEWTRTEAGEFLARAIRCYFQRVLLATGGCPRDLAFESYLAANFGDAWIRSGLAEAQHLGEYPKAAQAA